MAAALSILQFLVPVVALLAAFAALMAAVFLLLPQAIESLARRFGP